MTAPAFTLRTIGTWLLAWVMMLAVALLWQPRVAGRIAAATPVELGLAGTGTAQTEKGQTPRAWLAKRGAEDRASGPLPGLALPAAGPAGPASRLAAGGARPDGTACRAATPCRQHGARAPPLA